MEDRTLIWYGEVEAVLDEAIKEDKNVLYVGNGYVEWDRYTGRRGPVLKNTFGFNEEDRCTLRSRLVEGTLLAAMHVGYTDCRSKEEFQRIAEKDEKEVIDTLRAIGDMYEVEGVKNGTYIIVDVGEYGGFMNSDELQKILVNAPEAIQLILLTDTLATFDDRRWWSRDIAYGVEGEA